MYLTTIYLATFGCCVAIAWGIAQMQLLPEAQAMLRGPLALDTLLVRRRKTKLARWLDRLTPWTQRLFENGLGARMHRLFEQRLTTGRVALNAVEFLTVKVLAMLGGIVVYVGIVGIKAVEPPWLIGCALAGFVLPDLWLQRRLQLRRRSIMQDLPEAVDLLTLCVESGGDFMNAMQRVVQGYRRCPLTEELAAMLQEIRMGKRRREALRNLAQRLEIPDVSSMVRTLVQADRMGTGLSEALKIHSEDSRLRRFHHAERFAARAPIKMLLPLLLIMGAVAGIVGAPILIRFLSGSMLPKF